jgi:nucleotide-binding universal stress UspA family protein
MRELPSYRTILVATDGSDFAAVAEDHALALARQTGARLEGVCVVDRRMASQLGALGPEVLEELKGDSQRALDRVAQRARQAGVDVGTHLAEGRVGPTLLSEAARLGADMIVLGSHGQGTLLDVLMGSVSLYVLHHSPIPVCIVRPSRQEGS